MRLIVFKKVSKTYDDQVHAVLDVSLTINRGETLVILGKSGCGKTTIMKMINRLIDPSSGNIFIDGKNILHIDPIELRRNIGYFIQHVGLFEHMTVEENISIVPKLLKWNKKKISKRIDELLELVGCHKKYKNRYPSQLSGGEKQRIGVARALAADPPIILMDEPFGALDPITREQIQNEFVELESDIHKTVVLVTHDIFEAVKMADRIALMDKGKILQVSTPEDLIENPENAFAEQFLGQHRFWLTLKTRSIKDRFVLSNMNASTNCYKPSQRLSPKTSIVDAFDLFKTTKKSALPVFHQKKFLGMVEKKQLYSSVIEILKEKEL